MGVAKNRIKAELMSLASSVHATLAVIDQGEERNASAWEATLAAQLDKVKSARAKIKTVESTLLGTIPEVVEDEF